MSISVSVIIPLGPIETEWVNLVSQLDELPDHGEIILACSNSGTPPMIPTSLESCNIRVVNGKPGRAGQMNAAAKAAQNEFLWFLHADSRLDTNTISNLLSCLTSGKNGLYYHDLVFLPDGPSVMRFNGWGVWFRSRLLKTPFGDQGFCLKSELFFELGGYSEEVPYGEDHILVWRALQNGISLIPTGAKLFTSARKYSKNGWFRTTITHLYLWVKQALPEFWIYLKRRIP